jgi:DNA repair protein RadC
LGNVLAETRATRLAPTLQKISTVYIGSLNSSLVRVGEVFKDAIRLNSASIIVVHNHPSGQPDPSPEDVLVTRQIVEAGQLLDCEVLDHLVIGNGRYVSMRERGLGFAKEGRGESRGA